MPEVLSSLKSEIAPIFPNEMARKEEVDNLQEQIDAIAKDLDMGAGGVVITPPAPSSEADSGDIPIMPLDRCAAVFYQLRTGLSALDNVVTDGITGYNDNMVGGYMFNGPQKMYLDKMFNRIKMVVGAPGWVRIGIVKGSEFVKAKPRYSYCLVKWLLVTFAAYTGYHEWDIDDEIITDLDHYLYVECRGGITGAYSNPTTSSVTFGTTTYPANSGNTGALKASAFDSTVHGEIFKSQNILSASARFIYQAWKSSRGGAYPRGWVSYDYSQTSNYATGVNPYYNPGDLNLGIYRKGSGGDEYLNPVVENFIDESVVSNTTPNIWIPPLQETIVGKSIYAIKLDVTTAGSLTIYHGKGKTVADFQVLRKWTVYVRAIGLQTIRLPEDIILKEGEWVGVNGFHVLSTSTNIVGNTCKFAYGSGAMPTGSWVPHVGSAGDFFPPKNGAVFWESFGLKNAYPEQAVSKTNHTNAQCYLNICLVIRGKSRSKLEDLWVSITGDSISTYRGTISRAADVPAGNVAGDNSIYYPDNARGLVNNPDAMWWGVLARDGRMRLLLNDSWSGGRISGATGAAGCNDARIQQLRNQTAPALNHTKPYGVPDIILSCMGTNDISGNVAMGSAVYNSSFDSESILGAFSQMCYRLKSNYLQTTIVHFLIPRGSTHNYVNGNSIYLSQVAEEMETIAKAFGQFFIPLSYFERFNAGTAPYYFNCSGTWHRGVQIPTSTDALHPNAQGMEVIAQGVKRFLEEKL